MDGAIIVQGVRQQGESLWRDLVVGVQRQDVAATGGSDAGVQSAREVLILGIVDDPEPVVAGGITVGYLAAVVGGGVVHDDALPVAHRLGGHRIQRLGEISSKVVGRHDDRDLRTRPPMPRHHLVIEVDVGPDNILPLIARLHHGAGLAAHSLVILQAIVQPLDQAVVIAGLCQPAGDAVLDDVDLPAPAPAQNRHTRSHRFQGADAERLPRRAEIDCCLADGVLPLVVGQQPRHLQVRDIGVAVGAHEGHLWGKAGEFVYGFRIADGVDARLVPEHVSPIPARLPLFQVNAVADGPHGAQAVAP